MKIEKQIEELARLEFQCAGVHAGHGGDENGGNEQPENPLINGLDDADFHQFCKCVGGTCFHADIHHFRMTPAQWREAELRAVGKWEEEEELSACCCAPFYPETDICTQCKEHG